MIDNPHCLTAEEIIQPLPSDAELPDLRAKVKRVKSPSLPAGAHWGNSKVGSYTTVDSPEGVVISWSTIDGIQHTALFEALGFQPSYEFERLELGWMIANMLRIEAVRMLRTIPGPNEAMAEAGRYYREEERWRCWALLGSNPPPKKQRRT